MSFHSQSVKKKIVICFSCVVTLFIALGVWNVYSFERLYARFRKTASDIERYSDICLNAADSALSFSSWCTRSLLGSRQTEEHAAFRVELAQFLSAGYETVSFLTSLTGPPVRLPAVRAAVDGWNIYTDAVNMLFREGGDEDAPPDTALAIFALNAAEDAYRQTRDLRAALMDSVSVYNSGDLQFMQHTRILFACFFFFGIFFCIIIGVFLSMQIGEPAESMQKVVQDIMSMEVSLEDSVESQTKDEYLVFSDIIRLTRRGLRDNLTGLPTRALFTEALKKRLDSLPPDTEAAVYFIDMDNLKKINDTFGHMYGDEAHKYFGTKLTHMMGSRNSLLCRYGGDEFVVYVQGIANIAGARALGEEMIKTLAGHIEVDTRVLFFSASIGCALYPLHASDMSVLIGMADKALYTAKQNGKFSCSIYDQLTDQED